VPPSVESRIVEFVSSGVEGIEAVLNLRLVCKTTKAWVDYLPIRQAHRVFSKTFVTTRNYQVTEEYVSKLKEFPPPNGVTNLHLEFHPRNDPKNEDTSLEKFFEFWSPRVERLSLEIFAFDRNDNQHNEIAKLINSFLDKSTTNLRELNFNLKSLADLYALQEFLLQRKSTDKIHINLMFRGRSLNDNRFMPIAESLRAILISIYENKSLYNVDMKEEYFLYNIEEVAGAEPSIYDNFVKSVRHLEIKEVSESLTRL